MNLDDIRVTLDLFEGPLDLLLHLIQEQRIDITSISIARITDQYLSTLELMQDMDLNIAGEYLVMAATLLLIKSKMLLPPTPDSQPEPEDDVDLRARLVARLKEYRLFREAGRFLKEMQSFRETVLARPESSPLAREASTEWIIDATLVDILRSLKDVLGKTKEKPVHIIPSRPVSIRGKMTFIMEYLEKQGTILLSELFRRETTKQGMIAVFLAVLELIRMRVIQARQRSLYGEIRLALLAKIE